MKRRSPLRRIPCPICKEIFTTPREVFQHAQHSHPQAVQEYLGEPIRVERTDEAREYTNKLLRYGDSQEVQIAACQYALDAELMPVDVFIKQSSLDDVAGTGDDE